MSKKTPKKKTRQSKNTSTDVVMVCKNHEDYRAIYPPKTDCLV